MSEVGSSVWLAGVRTLLDRLETTQGAAIEALAIAGCDSISGGGIVHVAGTGHSAIIPLEAFHRAGGLAAMNPLWILPRCRRPARRRPRSSSATRRADATR